MKTSTTFYTVLIVVFFLTATLNAQWVKTNGPEGGDVYCFATIGTNLFAGTWGSGVFFSTDNGTSWTSVNSGLTYNVVYALAVKGTNLFARA